MGCRLGSDGVEYRDRFEDVGFEVQGVVRLNRKRQ